MWAGRHHSGGSEGGPPACSAPVALGGLAADSISPKLCFIPPELPPQPTFSLLHASYKHSVLNSGPTWIIWDDFPPVYNSNHICKDPRPCQAAFTGFPGAGHGLIFAGAASQPVDPEQMSTPSQEEPQLVIPGDNSGLPGLAVCPHPGDSILGISGTAHPTPRGPALPPIHVICRPLKSRDFTDQSLRFQSTQLWPSVSPSVSGTLKSPISRAAVRMKELQFLKEDRPHTIGVVLDYHSSNSPPGLPYS